MTGDVKAIFLDTNVLVYANVQESPWHQVAVDIIEQYYQAGIELWLSRQILREFTAVLTRPQTFTQPRPIATVTARVRFFEENFYLAEDNSVVTTNLLTLLETIPIGGAQVHDANIVATMQAYNLTHLLTYNTQDFNRFAHLITILPLVNK